MNLKNFFIILTLLFSSFFSSLYAIEEKDFVGMWEGIDQQGRKVAFLFQKEGYLTIITSKKVIGGQAVREDGLKISFKYSFDANQNPIHLDFSQTKGEKTETVKLLARFIDPYRLLLYGEGDANNRPAKINFNDSKNLVILFKTY